MAMLRLSFAQRGQRQISNLSKRTLSRTDFYVNEADIFNIFVADGVGLERKA